MDLLKSLYPYAMLKKNLLKSAEEYAIKKYGITKYPLLHVTASEVEKNVVASIETELLRENRVRLDKFTLIENVGWIKNVDDSDIIYKYGDRRYVKYTINASCNNLIEQEQERLIEQVIKENDLYSATDAYIFLKKFPKLDAYGTTLKLFGLKEKERLSNYIKNFENENNKLTNEARDIIKEK
jgi:hypothetical protein